MLEKPQSREDILEHCHNEIVKIIVDHKLLASDIILILDLIKGSIIKQLSDRYYVQSIPKTTKTPIQSSPTNLPKKSFRIKQKKCPLCQKKLKLPILKVHQPVKVICDNCEAEFEITKHGEGIILAEE